jgi:hypothetical protein
VFLATGVIAAHTMTDLSLQMAASGASSSQWVIIRAGEPAKFSEVVPGTYSACVVPFPEGVKGMAAMGYGERHSDSLKAFCQSVRVNPSPADQTAQVLVELPPFVPDDTGSGSASP